MEERQHKSTYPSPHRQQLPIPPTLKSDQRNRIHGSVLHPLQVQHSSDQSSDRLPRQKRRNLFMINRRKNAKRYQAAHQKKQRGFWEQYPTPEPRPNDKPQPMTHNGQENYLTAEKKTDSITRTKEAVQPDPIDANKHSASDTDTKPRTMGEQSITNPDQTIITPPSISTAKDKTLPPTPTRTPTRKPSPIPFHDLPKRIHDTHHPPNHQLDKLQITEVNNKPPIKDIHSREHDYWKRCKQSKN